MKILESKTIKVKDTPIEREYVYRLLESTYLNSHTKIEVFGIEIERHDYISSELVAIERDNCIKISPIRSKVKNIYDLAVEHAVSPIHFVEIFGEIIDECVNDFI